MKTLIRGALLFVCVGLVNALAAQKNPLPVREPDLSKPSLFTQLPDRILVSVSDLESLVMGQTDQRVDQRLSLGFDFRGVVSSVSTATDSLMRSVSIRSTNFNGALLHIARIRENDGQYRFTGRIISLQHQDAYELVFEKNSYFLVKKSFYDLINE